MELWKKVWREGIAPQMSQDELSSLAKALREDNIDLIQGATCLPAGTPDAPTEAACALSWGGIGQPVKATEDRFQQFCDGCDERMNERAVCRYFLNWFDDTPRDHMRRELLTEVQAALFDRAAKSA